MPDYPVPDRLPAAAIDVEVAALVRAADLVGGATVATAPPSLVGVVADAVVELGAARSADALAAFAAGWQQVVLRLGQRAAALARALSSAASAYTVVDGAMPIAAHDASR
jgi:hypothetical protein